MKIVVPIMPRSLEEAQSIDVDRYHDADIIEWRADYLAKEDILKVAPAVFEKFAGWELIFTIRTSQEGGNLYVTDAEYASIIKEIQSLYQPDYVDFEFYSHPVAFEEMMDYSNLILSYHNFQDTPDNLMEILSELTSLSPKVVKVAVTSKTEQEVLDLMSYTRGFKTLNPEQEFVTMSMGRLGKVSRIACDLIGSSWTFANLDEVSAPGQISLHHIKRIREVLSED